MPQLVTNIFMQFLSTSNAQFTPRCQISSYRSQLVRYYVHLRINKQHYKSITPCSSRTWRDCKTLSDFPFLPIKYTVDCDFDNKILHWLNGAVGQSLSKTTQRKLTARWRQMLPWMACMFLGPFESEGLCNLSAVVLVWVPQNLPLWQEHRNTSSLLWQTPLAFLYLPFLLKSKLCRKTS